mmetsp:Transcript_6960/g.10487  ORF Transcript_6960/g.10487 Transcript_6960/m.10487 type:complete len:485 (-) Transcript_6960:73-1527(-)|eukprot:CAMPEP_0113947566 /NCGR_PEP_ID=MMETSP1339-20121228/65461_1 /TAXON_ID=94617 /ORGANISM="Fibrocapsa japonica" /LENGTH=484 /DNA_ID=CAMNT_0000954215 /DNA_START=1 /DNA_END=1455 /DNA_ORIENTATION=- /assembly_acc=CAM_ASM_000762
MAESDSLLSVSTLNPNLVEAKYAVRGPILDRAMELGKQLKEGKSLPFNDIIACNIGNPQALQQKALTYNREVISCILNPAIMKLADMKSDVAEVAQEFLNGMPSVGAYSNSQGLPVAREKIAKFIEKRDGHPANIDHLFITNGASEGVRYLMQAMIRGPTSGKKDGVLTPIPQYPLYSCLNTMLSGNLVPYYLDEATGWSLSVENLAAQLSKARSDGITVRGLVVINPGNPTGQTLSLENMQQIVDFCAGEQLVLLADEVYQENIWNPDKPFYSFKKVACDMGYNIDPSKKLQLVSFHSVSKGFLGECGLRGGYFELYGIPDDVKAQLYKMASVSLCSNTIGQISIALMCSPPEAGSASYDLYQEEKNTILDSLKRRNVKLIAALNELEGVTANDSDGAMYAFPQLVMPQKFVEAAEAKGAKPDEFYCMEMLNATGIVTVPGSGFGQVDGTWHFRTTFLPPEDKIDVVIEKMGEFHRNLMAQYK